MKINKPKRKYAWGLLILAIMGLIASVQINNEDNVTIFIRIIFAGMIGIAVCDIKE